VRLIVSLLFVVTGLAPLLVLQAQKTSKLVSVSGVSTRASSNGTLVTIVGDGPLSQAETWQDSEGFHVMVPNAGAAGSIKTGPGVGVRRVGKSLEILLRTKPGASVTVRPLENRLNLAISGSLEPGTAASASSTKSSTDEAMLAEEQRRDDKREAAGAAAKELKAAAADLSSPKTIPAAGNQASNLAAIPPAEPLASQQVTASSDEEGTLSSILTDKSMLVIAAVVLLALLGARKFRSRRAGVSGTMRVVLDGEMPQDEWPDEPRDPSQSWQSGESNMGLVKVSGSVPAGGVSRERKSSVHVPVTTPASLYGAYRIDQEVGKLILGQAHRMDVLSSRAPDDRRAIETSLIKVIASPDSDETQRRKAREALEEYGFVARQCASLLLSADAFERTSAARSLGEIKSPAALPFLLEGLYDHESIVRNQAVVSVGELKLPMAIGALLDMARIHPDVPSTLLSRSLSACSVEGLDFFDTMAPEPALFTLGQSDSFVPEITRLQPALSVEDLPERSNDEGFAEAIAKLQSSSPEERSEAVKELAQYQIQSSVAALSSVALHDNEANIRALAVSSLSSINHESVFPAVLIGMADESREVRAAAARSLSRLSFDRADAYVRVMETADEKMLRDVAHACIQAGIVSQNIDRITSSDRRQAYEAFSLICLLAKAKMIEPILEAICNHANIDVRVSAVHLLVITGQPEIFEQLRQLTLRNGIIEEVRTALLEAMYKLDQARLKPTEAPKAFWSNNEPVAETQGVEESKTNGESQFGAFAPDFATEFERVFEPVSERKVERHVTDIDS
jgi:HEAT repeat protein